MTVRAPLTAQSRRRQLTAQVADTIPGGGAVFSETANTAPDTAGVMADGNVAGDDAGGDWKEELTDVMSACGVGANTDILKIVYLLITRVDFITVKIDLL